MRGERGVLDGLFLRLKKCDRFSRFIFGPEAWSCVPGLLEEFRQKLPAGEEGFSSPTGRVVAFG
jgi:hypothetical protein